MTSKSIVAYKTITDRRRVDQQIPVRMGGMNLKERKPKKRKVQPVGDDEEETLEKKKR